LEKVKNNFILGIDPGTSVTGYSLIEATKPKPTIHSIGIIDVKKLDNHYKKLKHIYDRVLGLVTEYQPDVLAIEAPFYGKNIQSMLKLGRAQGAAITAALSIDIPIFEYAPRKIKVAITGNGNASKEQVSEFLQSYLNFKLDSKYHDASDALAAAVCHYFQNPALNQSKSYKNWNDFIKKNPDRLA
jgi:crossover junction endodeoxyribonuclease RuvC